MAKTVLAEVARGLPVSDQNGETWQPAGCDQNSGACGPQVRPARSGSWPSAGTGRAALFALRTARRASFSFCLACLARSRSRFASVAFPRLAMMTSSG